QPESGRDPAGPWPALQVGFRTGGERIRPVGYKQHRTLKNLFQEHSVPPWVRRRTPLLWHDDELIAVGRFWHSAHLEALQRDYRVRLVVAVDACQGVR
ncbi:MAG: tRNA lysidine(34) synthetase TilS, partial [Xanthomonadales bacterium]|nr:tRNA lysidine(34) synthetase TilS [Xanthomonadales bacterium]